MDWLIIYRISIWVPSCCISCFFLIGPWLLISGFLSFVSYLNVFSYAIINITGLEQTYTYLASLAIAFGELIGSWRIAMYHIRWYAFNIAWMINRSLTPCFFQHFIRIEIKSAGLYTYALQSRESMSVLTYIEQCRFSCWDIYYIVCREIGADKGRPAASVVFAK